MTPSELSLRQREATRGLVLDALERVLAAHGLGGVSIRRVAREAGVAVGTVYLYFDSRDAMLHAWMIRGFGIYQARIESLPAETWADPERAIEAIMRAFISFALDNSEAFRLARSAEIRALDATPPLDSPEFLDAPGNELALQQLRALAAAGRLAPERVPHAMVSLWSATQGLVQSLLEQPELNAEFRDGLIDFHVQLLLRGLLTRPAGGET